MTKSMLPMPPVQAVCIIVEKQSQAAFLAHGRMKDPADQDAVHDFRVALRRLRAWCCIFDQISKIPIKKGTRKTLKALASATNIARDLEVHKQYLKDLVGQGSVQQTAFYDSLIEGIERQLAQEAKKFSEQMSSQFLHAHKALQGSFQKQSGASEITTFSEVLQPRLQESLDSTVTLLALVKTLNDQKTAHKARLSAKRLRYLLEPLAPEVESAAGVVAHLKSLQDRLGDLHDIYVFRQELKDQLRAARKSDQVFIECMKKLRSLLKAQYVKDFKLVIQALPDDAKKLEHGVGQVLDELSFQVKPRPG